ncbi:MAG: ABC transporter permease [Candidatus Gastranaerophilales bacterium]|nr:ABC transporter permease [Candidatus Gastranaerophilales bacterium]
MENIHIYFKQTATYQLSRIFFKQLKDFFETLGEIGIRFVLTLKYILKGQISWKQVVDCSSRFAVDSLPITLSIVAMTAIIVAVQVAPEMIKQGGKDYIGMLVAMIMVREVGAIMSGFAIISMIGSAIASEIATMRVTEQIDALKVLKVDPFKYLFVPRVISGTIMMPFVVTIASFVGILAGGMASSLVSPELSGLNYVSSVWHGLALKDISICILFKSAVFGAAITLISASCGYDANGGAKGVGLATTKAVVWSFVAIVIIDYLFALIFYF